MSDSHEEDVAHHAYEAADKVESLEHDDLDDATSLYTVYCIGVGAIHALLSISSAVMHLAEVTRLNGRRQ